MATLEELSEYAQTAQAAYATGLVSGANNTGEFVQYADMSASQATQFNDTWNVLQQSESSLDGFSAVLLQNRETGEKVLAIAGTSISDVGDLLTDFFNVGVLGSVIAAPQYISLLEFYSELVSTGVLTFSEEFTVTGHSLGGFLAQAFAVNFPNVVSAAYTYNAPGFVGTLGQLLDFLGAPDAVPGITITNVRAQEGIAPISGFGIHVGTTVNVSIEPDILQFGNHSIARLTDSLAIQAVLNTLDTNLSQATSNALVQTASDQSGNTLESLLDSVLHILVGDINTGTDDRESFYINLKGLGDQLKEGGSLAALAGNLHVGPVSNVLGTEAKTEFSALIALQTLSTVALHGSNAANQAVLDAKLGEIHADTYALWQADQSLTAAERAAGGANFSDQWLSDRATMLNILVQRNTLDTEDPLSTRLSGGVAKTFLDLQSGIYVDTGGGGANKPKIVFGTDGSDSCWGGSGSDRIYGGAGSDQLYGEGGDDYLEGGEGNDTLTTGTGRDTLVGGAGFDVYNISTGAELTTILDADGSGSIVIEKADHSFYTLGEKLRGTAGSPGSYIDKQGNHYQLSGTTLAVQIADGGQRLSIENFDGNDLGISLNIPYQTAIAEGTSNPFDDPDYVPTTQSMSLTEGSAKTMTVALNTSAIAGQRVRLSADNLSDVLAVVAAGGQLHFINGSVELTLEAGQTSVTFSLLERGELAADTNLSLTATLLDSAGIPMGTASSLNLALEATDSAGSSNAAINYVIDPTVSTGVRIFGPTYGDLSGNAPGGAIAQYYLQTWESTDSPTSAGAYASQFVDFSNAVPQSGHDLVTVDGGLGDSYILGSAYRDAIVDGVNTGGSTTLFGGTIGDNDILYGGLGDDVLQTHGGDDQSYGGDGNDLIIDTPIGQSGLAYSDRFWLDAPGHSNNDRLYGEAGNDLIVAGGGNALLDGGTGNDELYGGADDDTLLGGDGDDVLWGDSLQTDLLWTVANEVLYSATDIVAGSKLYEAGGVVEIVANAGRDFLDGGAGNDELRGGGNSDVLYGGTGNDILIGDAAGDDANAGDDCLNGEDGDDQITGMAGSDTLIGGAGNDVLVGDGDGVGASYQGNDFLDGGAGNDYLWGDGGSDTLLGGAGNDYLQGDSSATPIDIQGDDYLDGGDGDDTLVGDGGNDTLLGGAGNDQLSGGSGDDYLNGGTGTDYLWGGDGNDILVTGPTGNLLAAGDVLQGEAGDDTYILNAGMGSVRIEDTEGVNTLVFAGASGDIGVQMVDGLIVITLPGGDSVVMSAATANTMDNGLYSSTLTQNADGSSVSTITTYGSDGTSTEYGFATATGGAVTQTNRYLSSTGALTRKLVTNPDGATVDKAYIYQDDGSKTVTTLSTAANGTDVTTTFDEFGIDGKLFQKTVTAPGGGVTVYAYHYDATGILTDRVGVASDGTQTTAYYDATGQLVSREVVTASGVLTETYYGNDGALTEKVVTKADHTVTTYHYNANGDVSASEQLNPDGSTSNKTYVYQADGTKTITEMATAAGASVSTTTASDYDAAGQLAHRLTTSPDGSTEDRSFVYAEDGSKVLTMVSTEADAITVTTTVFGYDPAGRLIDKVLTQPDGTVIDYDYTSPGSNIVSRLLQTNPDGSIVNKTFQYKLNGEYAVTTSTLAYGDTTPMAVTAVYDAFGNLRSKDTISIEGIKVIDLFNSLGKVSYEYTYNLDGSLTTEKYTYRADGSKTSTVTTTLDGELVGASISKTFDAEGMLRGKHVVDADGTVSDYTYDDVGRLWDLDQHQIDGSQVDKSYSYSLTGAKTETVATTTAGETEPRVVINYYDVSNVLTARQVTNPDGSATLTGYNADGSVTNRDTHNVDGSYIVKSYAYNGDGSSTVTVDNIPATGGAGKVVIYEYDAGGVQTGKTVGSEASTITDDGADNITTHFYAPNGFETHDAWIRADGSYGQDSFGRDGSSSGNSHNGDGSYNQYVNDSVGNTTKTFFDAIGTKLAEEWTKIDGSSGATLFYSDGSSDGYSHYSDGTRSQSHNDGEGNWHTEYFDANDVLLRDENGDENGSGWTTAYAPDGAAISGTWSGGIDSYGIWAQQVDGTYVEEYSNGLGDFHVDRYADDYSMLLGSHAETMEDGQTITTDYLRYADGSWGETWASTDGTYGFTVGNPETFGFRGFVYHSITDWMAYEAVESGNGPTGIEYLYAVSSSSWAGDVRYFDNTPLYFVDYSNAGRRIVSDTDFGMDPLQGISLTYGDPNVYDTKFVENIQVSPGALLHQVSDQEVSYVDSDPFGEIHQLIQADAARYGDLYNPGSLTDVIGISYYSEDASLNGYITRSGSTQALQTYLYHGINGTDGYWNYDPSDPIYVPSSGGGSGGGSDGIGGPRGSGGSGGSGSGGTGTTTIYYNDGYANIDNGLYVPGSDLYWHNSSGFTQYSYSGMGGVE